MVRSQVNKNTLGGNESRLLGDKFYCQLVLLCYFFVWNTKRVLYVCLNVNTQNLKFARRDSPHILASHWCEAFEKPSAYSRLSLNGHLYKTDTFPKLAPPFLYSLYLTLYKTDISLRWTLTAGPKGRVVIKSRGPGIFPGY